MITVKTIRCFSGNFSAQIILIGMNVINTSNAALEMEIP